MRIGSLFTGIGGFDLALERAGHTICWQVEKDPACRTLLERRFPGVPIHEDVRSVGPAELPPVDLICGGFPCQDLSVAGRRAGLSGERSGLWFEFHRLLGSLAPQWCLIENVPGLLSSHGGRDFAVLLEGLVQLGYRVAWRVLDAQYAGLAQRRKRVFVVGHLGDGAAAEVLLEPESLLWNPPPSRKTGQDPARPPGGSSQSGGYRTTDLDHGALLADPICANEQRTYTPDSDTKDGHLIPATFRKSRRAQSSHHDESWIPDDLANTVNTFDVGEARTTSAVLQPIGVRRLTPLECERLQGFPDHWTEGHADSTRYRMLGNAVAVPVALWIARRLPR